MVELAKQDKTVEVEMEVIIIGVLRIHMGHGLVQVRADIIHLRSEWSSADEVRKSLNEVK